MRPSTAMATASMTDDTRDRTKRLADPALMAKIRDFVPRKLQPADADEIVQKVFLRLLLIATLPPTQDRLTGLAVIVTRQVALDHFRRAGVVLKREADVDEHAELLPAPELEVSLDEEQQIRLMLEKVEQDAVAGRIPESLVTIARLLAEGKTHAEIAALTGTTEAAVKMQVSRLRRHLRQHWPKWVAAAVSVVAIAFVVFASRRYLSDFGIGPDHLAASASATPRAAPAASTPPEDAQTLRDRAMGMCMDGFYLECEKDLDGAKQVDPASEARPEVKEMRATIATWKARREQQQGPLKPDKPR